jgi:nicotinamidase/pyrazinamidase
MVKRILLVVDPQVDFHEGGALGVPGANADSDRIAQFIREKGDEIDEIYVTLDSHHRLHVAHAVCWKDKDGNEPAPFTLIKHDDVEKRVWIPKDDTLLEYIKYYTRALEEKGRFVMCIWPEHCLLGTPGHSVVSVLNDALQAWCRKKMTTVNYIMKGTNCMTEMYSALQAEVPIPADPTTCLDPVLVAKLNKADQVLICGQAKSHCVNYTMRDLVDNWKSEKSKLVLLSDGCSSVPGFEEAGEQFEQDMIAAGCTVCSIASV